VRGGEEDEMRMKGERWRRGEGEEGERQSRGKLRAVVVLRHT
jgi:hypothetical protein